MYLGAQSAVAWIGLTVRRRRAVYHTGVLWDRVRFARSASLGGHREGLTQEYDRMGHVVLMPGDSISKCVQPISGYGVQCQ